MLFLAAICTSAAAMDCHLGESYYDRAKSSSDPARQREWLQRSTELCPSFNAWYMLGLLHAQQGRSLAAVDAFTRARAVAATSKTEALALARRGEALAHIGKIFTAIDDLTLAKRFHPAPLPDWVEISLKNARIQSWGEVMPAAAIAAFLEAGTRISGDRRIVVRPGVNIPVHFDFDRSDLNTRGLQQTVELGTALTRPKLKPWYFLLVGHTDKRGSRSYNQVLSEKRALSVSRELERRFPDLIGRLKTEGHGESELLYEGDSESDHMLNRRVKVTLVRSGR